MPKEPESPASLRRKRIAARTALTECAMPLCSGDTLAGLGVCRGCAVDLFDYFAQLDEQPELTERALQRRYRELEDERKRADAAESQAMQAGWVYYIRVTDRIKIGYSTNVKNRMRAYPPHAELLAIHPGTPTLEREMHARFVNHLAEGREWFRPDPEVMAHIDRVTEQFGPVPKRMVYRFREGTPQQTKVHRSSRTHPGRRR